jgi:hypothetical protein
LTCKIIFAGFVGQKKKKKKEKKKKERKKERKKYLGTDCYDHIKIDLKETGLESVDWIHLDM